MSTTNGHHLGGGALGGLGIFGFHEHEEHGGLFEHHDVVEHHEIFGHHAGKGLGMSGSPLDLVFPDPAPVAGDHVFNLAAVALPGGVTASLIALVAISCLVIVLASALVRTVVVRCSSN
jgi:hypothetical protein